MTCGGRFVAGDAPQRTFAASQGDGRMTLEVNWRSGKKSVIDHVIANYLYEIDESVAVETPPPTPRPKPVPLFEDVSASLGHRHEDPAFDDFSRQMLLPRRLSQLGPGVAWFDLNEDGKEDLIFGGGRGTSLGVYLNSGDGHWKQAGGLLTNTLPDDAAGVVAGVLQSGRRSLLVGLAHYETQQTNLPSVWRYDWTASGAAIGALLPTLVASCGPLALADVYGDGNLALFVGGRLKAGRYPEAPDCALFKNQGGQLVADEAANGLLAKAGLVTGAVFSDLDDDGFPELVLACEWGPARVFHNEHGRFREWDLPLSVITSADPPSPGHPLGASKLSELRGLWTSVETGDFNGDGRMDIVLGNWGLNSSHQHVAPGHWFLYYGDFKDDGGMHIFEAFQDLGLKQVVPWRDLTFMEKDLPWLRARFPTHQAYADASLSALLGDRMSKARSLQVEVLGSMLLLNRGSKFEIRLLPPEAQWSPVMGIAVGDLDGDGKEDLFLSQNFFAVRPEDGRLDAGRGLLMRGDGKGGFAAVPGPDSGIVVYGEQRGCALADYDGDGRVDLVVTQNNAETRLFHNLRAQVGLRVKLAGPPGNPEGIGAVVRLEFKGKLGRAREVQAGSGFWSQNSPVQVLGMHEMPTGVQVRWPGGKGTHSEVPATAKSIIVDASGGVRVER